MAGERSASLTLRTPEGVAFSLRLAGPVSRFLAWVVDIACIGAALQLLRVVVSLSTAVSLDFGMAVNLLLDFLVSIGYAILLEWFWRGQTLGKRLLGLRVMDVQGLRLQFSQVVIRNLLRAVDSLPLCYLVGGLACLISRRAQRLGDFAANTLVIRHRAPLQPNLERALSDKFNSLRENPVLASRLRQKVPAEAAYLALRALSRRDELDPGARVELFRELAGYFRGLVRFPAEALEGVTDERFVQNVVDVVFRPRPDPLEPVAFVPAAGEA